MGPVSDARRHPRLACASPGRTTTEGSKNEVSPIIPLTPSRRSPVGRTSVAVDYARLVLLAGVFIAVVVVPLLLISRHPVRVIDVTVRPNVLNETSLYSTRLSTRTDRHGVAHFDLLGAVEDATVSRLLLALRPLTSSSNKTQPTCTGVSKGIFSCTVQLGEASSPLTGDQTYSFELTVDPDGGLLSKGQIDARVTSTVDTSEVTVRIVAVLASLVQVLTFLFPPTLSGTRVSSPKRGVRAAP